MGWSDPSCHDMETSLKQDKLKKNEIIICVELKVRSFDEKRCRRTYPSLEIVASKVVDNHRRWDVAKDCYREHAEDLSVETESYEEP